MPSVFHDVRDNFGVSDEVFRSAWGGKLELKLNDGGSSEAFFFFSSDKRFIVKSCTPGEMETLKNLAADYADHLGEYPTSFLARIYGAYNLVVYGTEFQFFVMENLFYAPLNKPVTIHERYDIKGSSVNRNFSVPKPGERATCRLCNEKFTIPKEGQPLEECRLHARGYHVPNVILKDNDLYTKFQISADAAIKVSTQLHLDSCFLKKYNIMDYSLLVGIHNKQVTLEKVNVTWQKLLKAKYEANVGEWDHILALDVSPVTPGNKSRRGICDILDLLVRDDTRTRSFSSAKGSGEPTTQGQDCCVEATGIVGPYSYYFGVIDMLQEWTWEKKIERFFKTWILQCDPSGLSAIEPEKYQERFMLRVGAIMNLTVESGSGTQLDPAEITLGAHPHEAAQREPSGVVERLSLTLRQRASSALPRSEYARQSITEKSRLSVKQLSTPARDPSPVLPETLSMAETTHSLTAANVHAQASSISRIRASTDSFASSPLDMVLRGERKLSRAEYRSILNNHDSKF